MNDAAWERLIDALDATLGFSDHGRSTRQLEDRPDLTEYVQYFEFSRDGQEYRIERVTGPAIIDRKSHYSHRAGTANRMEYIYDPRETASKVNLYRRQGDNWAAIDIDQLGL